MTKKFRTNLILFSTSILTPYCTVIFFIRTESLFIILPVILSAFIVLIISSIGLRRMEVNISRKKYYLLTAFLAVTLFFFSYGLQLDTADWVFFKLRETKLKLIVTELKKYEKIKEMTDGQRYWKSINNTSIEPNIASVDTSENFGEKYFLDDILQRDGVDKKHYEFFKNLLIQVDFISFTTFENGTISFTIDGFLDNCYGIAYSETGLKPLDNDCGQIISWTKIGKNWYSWKTT